jgi:3'(2'), 5'-bisphosphate nucleotidase
MPRLTLPRYIFLISTLILALSILPRLQQFARHLSRSRLLSNPPSAPITTMTSSTLYSKELHIALLAVQRATILTRAVYTTTAKGTLSKSDASPVTIGDFGAQALIISALKSNFPADEIVAEEEASDLRSNEALRNKIWSYVQNTKLDDPKSEQELGGSIGGADEMMDVIDQGNSQGGSKGRIWAIDPIDGTKGFLRGGQYAVCLALMVDGEVTVGVLGCPNLPVDDTVKIDGSLGHDQSGTEANSGVLFSAVKGRGATSRPLARGSLQTEHTIQMQPLADISQAKFCESVEAAHSNHSEQAQIANRLSITSPSVRMDSQAKYASIARGAGDIYLRLPVRKDYQEKIWDHAAGFLIVREAGGEVTDMHGNVLDFAVGRTLAKNKGIVAAPKAVHGAVLKAVQEVVDGKQN